MRIEDEVKALIKQKYKTISEFSRVIEEDIPTVSSMLNRKDMLKSSGRLVLKTCKFLGLDHDALADGRIVIKDDQPTANMVLFPNEVALVKAYRSRTDMQPAVDTLLGIEHDE